MLKANGAGFGTRLRGFLGSTKLARSTSVTRLSQTTKSLSTSPIEPVDALFSVISENYQPSSLSGFQSVTFQLLANDVLNSLISLQSDLSDSGSLSLEKGESLNSKAAFAYSRAQHNFAPKYRSAPSIAS